ncbi:MAG: TolC family protein [Bacteroidia bacterium]
MKQKIIFSILFLLLMNFSSAQKQKISLTLKDAIQLGKEKGLQAQINTNTFYAGQYQFKSQAANLLPNFSITGNLPGINRSFNSITQPDGTIQFVQQSQALSNATLNINQQITATGGSVYFSSVLNRFDVLGNGASTNWQSAPVLVGINQPIFRFNQYKFDWKIAQLYNKQNTRSYAEKMEDLSAEIVQKFFDVVIARIALEQERFNINVNDTLLRVARGRYNLGKIGEDDLLQTELRLMNAQNNFDQATLNYNVNENQLKILLGLDKNFDLNLIPEAVIPNFEPDVDKAMSEAKKNRSDILSIEISQKQTEANLKRASYNRLPNATLNASYGLNQTSPILSDAYKSPLDQQRATVGLNIPLMNWGKYRFDYRTAKYQMNAQQAQLDLQKLNIELEVINQIGLYLQLRKRLASSGKADTIAQKRYSVAKNRYLIGSGTITITDLNFAQNDKDAARKDYYATMSQFWLAYYHLRRLTLYDFEKDEVLFKQN